MNNHELDKVIRRAANAVVYEWPNVIEADDLAQELWVKILESPATQDVLAEKTSREQMNLLARMGHRIASRYRNNNLRFSVQVRYSAEDIKDALTGRSLWPEIIDDITLGIDALRQRNAGYADAIQRIREPDSEAMTPADRKRRERAIEALTETTNAVVRQLFAAYTDEPGKTLGDGPGTRPKATQANPNAKSIFDSEFNSMPGIDMYRSWVEPEMYPEESPARVGNWSQYDREDCGNG
ncbi:hypothetical protein ACWDYH_00475 [Nocardia goodfellowii]